MERLKLPFDRHGHDEESVMGWLEGLEAVAEAADEKDEADADPHTPRRRGSAREEEVSPTNTAFPSTRIFDQSDLARREESDDSNTSVTSISPSNNTLSPTNEESHLEPKSRTTTSPSSFVKTLTAVLTTGSSSGPIPMDTHISLLSCVACTSLSLPCSLTLPICIRCMRNSSMCVFLRHRMPVEIDAASIATCGLPVLVRQGESMEEWEDKLEDLRNVKDTMERMWDRQNWVSSHGRCWKLKRDGTDWRCVDIATVVVRGGEE